MGVIIKGGSSTAGNANVDSTFNLKVNTPTTSTEAGFSSAVFQQDAGAILGVKDIRIPSVSVDDRLSIGQTTIETLHNFTAGSQNTGDFLYANSVMTMTQSAGFLNINPALATGSGNYAYLQSTRYFTLQGQGELVGSAIGQGTLTVPPAGQIFEAGFFKGTAGVAPADGAFFRLTSAGLIGVISYAGVETPSSLIFASSPANENGQYQLRVSQRSVEFWVNGIKGATIDVPAGQAVPFLTLNLPITLMLRNASVITGGTTIKIGSANVYQGDLALNKTLPQQMATQGNAYQGQEGDAMGSLAIYSNAALAAAAAITNTTAAAGNIGLGGAALVLPTLAAGTDGILFSYLNPVGSTTQPPKTLVVTGVSISSCSQVAFTGGPLTLIYGIAYGHTALSLVTTESGSFVSPTTKAPRRVLLGTQGYAVTSAAGINGAIVDRTFISPITVNPGEYFQITMRNVGTVTSAGALAITASIDHYFE